MIEVEVKLRLNDRAATIVKLESLGFVKGATVRETDIYFNSCHHDFWKADEALRVRKVENLSDDAETKPVYTLTFKGPKLDDISMSRKEIETKVEDAEAIASILHAVGFSEVPQVEKVRCYFKCGQMTACVDRVTGLGDYLELELLVDADEKEDIDREKALLEIDAVLQKLGYSMEDTTRTSYLSALIGLED